MAAPIFIEVEADGPVVDFELMGRPKFLSRGDGHLLIGGGILYWRGARCARASGFQTISHFLLHVGEGVGTGLIAAYLYDKLKKGHATTLRIDRTEVQIDRSEITRVLEKHIGENK
jgi:hypothetical protein